MNRNPIGNSAFLQQKIIHLQAELSKYKSIQKDKLLSEFDKLRDEAQELREENAALKEKLATIQAEQRTPYRQPTKKQDPRANRESNQNESKSQSLDSWFIGNLMHEKYQKNK